MSLLTDAAEAWAELSKYSYLFTYGKKHVLTKVRLGFLPESFAHIAGFQYLKDITLPVESSSAKKLQLILSGKISQSQIESSLSYLSMVEPRLKAIVHLKTMLDGDFKTYNFDPAVLPFYTKIKAQYLLAGSEPNMVFLFTNCDANDESFYPCSAFVPDVRDYRTNQHPITILKKERFGTSNNEHIVLFEKPGFEEKETAPAL